MSIRARTLLLLPAALALGACAETIECSKPQFYQRAAVGKQIEIPEGLDPLPKERELTIPKASPQAPPPPGACVDMPPTLRTGSAET